MRRRVVLTVLVLAGLALAPVLGRPATAEEKVPKGEPRVAFDSPPPVGTTARCPVSKEVFTVKADTERSEYKGKHYVFCCPDCKPEFDKHPEKYVVTPPTR